MSFILRTLLWRINDDDDDLRARGRSIHCERRRRGIQKSVGRRQKVAIFRRTVANFRQTRHGCPTFSVYPLNWPKMGIFSPKVCIFGGKFSDKYKLFPQAKIYERGAVAFWRCWMWNKITKDKHVTNRWQHHARRSLSTVGVTHVCPPNRGERSTASRVANQPPHYCPPLIHLHSPSPPERCKVSQQVWNRVMNWTWACVSPYCDLLDYITGSQRLLALVG